MKKMQRFWWTLLLLLTAVWLTVNDGWQCDATFAQQPTEQLAPTASAVKVIVQEYAPADGERLERLLSLSPDKMAAEIAQKGKPTPAAIGHFRLEACLSTDRQFCALQLFRFADFRNNAVIEPRFYEGKDAEAAAQLL